jgi:hypothetical protein
MARPIISTLASIALFGSVSAAVLVAANEPFTTVPDNGVTVVGEALLAPAAFSTATPATTAPNVAACAGSAYSLSPWRLSGTFTWYYNPISAPASVATTALDALKSGTQSAFGGKNRCGASSSVNAVQAFAGTTTRAAQVSALGTCTGNDGLSVTSWGDLPVNTLAYTCTYYRTSTHAVLASDMLIDNKVHSWFTTQPASCSNKFDLESVVVHERGHTMGLNHVDQATQPTQTMSPKTRPCDVSKRLLARGDLAGLSAIYGVATK